MHKLVGSIWAITGLPQTIGFLVSRDSPNPAPILIRLMASKKFPGRKGERGRAGGFGGKTFWSR